jgi:hypothetical protein
MMVAHKARSLPARERMAYLRAVRSCQPDTFAALRNAPRPAVHFVGFRGEEFNSAVRVFGQPDFVHRHWDVRAQQEVARETAWDVTEAKEVGVFEDVVVFATAKTERFVPWTFDDSNQPDDPAAQERKEATR